MSDSTDRIEREIVLKAPRSRVWRALTDPEEFGAWWGTDLTGQTIAAGQRVTGPVNYPGYEHLKHDVRYERIEPEHLVSWRWHPGDAHLSVDETPEEMTLVEFHLRDVEGGTALKIVESGFDAAPVTRRMDEFRMNTEGWDEMMENISNHVAA